MEIARVAVIGAGTMGASITVALLASSYEVLLKDLDESALEKGLARIDRMLQSLVKRGLPDNEADKCRELISRVTDYKELAGADLVIEAVPEELDVKTDVLRQLEVFCKPDVILASSTSSLSITQMASRLERRERVAGMHFFNPAHAVKLVEVIRGLDTSAKTVRTLIEFGRSLNKLSIEVHECASFLVNRLLNRYMSEALWCLEETTASFEDIEKAACDLTMPIGPLTLRDMSGADIGLAAANFNYLEYGERFKPSPVLEEMVHRNWLGQKSGRGFYIYEPETKRRLGVNEELRELILAKASPFVAKFQPERLFLPMINEAFFALQEGICKIEDLDPALVAGTGMKKGPLAMAEEMGLSRCLAELESLCKAYGERFRPCPYLRRIVLSGRKSVDASIYSEKESSFCN